jgi:hypothetical protein
MLVANCIEETTWFGNSKLNLGLRSHKPLSVLGLIGRGYLDSYITSTSNDRHSHSIFIFTLAASISRKHY